MSIRARMIILPYLSYLIIVLLKRPTWRLSDVITSNFNIVRWSWRRPCVHRHLMTTDVLAPSLLSSHIHYINSDLRRHFIIIWLWHLSVLTSCHVLSADYVRVWLVHFFFFFLRLHAVETFSHYFPLSPRCILSCLILSPRWIQFYLLLSPILKEPETCKKLILFLDVPGNTGGYFCVPEFTVSV